MPNLSTVTESFRDPRYIYGILRNARVVESLGDAPTWHAQRALHILFEGGNS